MGGLQSEIEMAVRMFNPVKLADVYSLSKLHEATINASKKRFKPLLPSPTPRYGSNNYNQASTSQSRPYVLPALPLLVYVHCLVLAIPSL